MRSGALANETAPAQGAPSLYDRDFALWVEAQVAAIRAGDPGALDVENLVEELEGFGHIPLLDITPGEGHADRGAELVGAPGGDPPVVNAVPTDAAASLGQVQGDGACG